MSGCKLKFGENVQKGLKTYNSIEKQRDVKNKTICEIRAIIPENIKALFPIEETSCPKLSVSVLFVIIFLGEVVTILALLNLPQRN